MIDSLKRWVSNNEDAKELLEKICSGTIPEHVAIITDGNGRWAKKRGLPRTAGYAVGMKRVRETIRAANDLGIKVLTFYSFSTENWKRPEEEITYLMKLPKEFLKTDLQELMDRNVQVRMMGTKDRIPSFTQQALAEFEEKTKNNNGMILNFAINYGARTEIMNAVRQIIDDVEKGNIDKEQLNEQVMNQYLLTRGLPDPDLIIRTSGEIRVSNFLLWQLAYSEFWFTNVLWPDFHNRVFFEAIIDFQSRSRRYGAV